MNGDGSCGTKFKEEIVGRVRTKSHIESRKEKKDT